MSICPSKLTSASHPLTSAHLCSPPARLSRPSLSYLSLSLHPSTRPPCPPCPPSTCPTFGAVLFLKDIQDYLEARRLAALAEEKGEAAQSPVAQGYQQVQDEEAAAGDEDEAILEIEAKPAPQSR